jgi:hypothetical protein
MTDGTRTSLTDTNGWMAYIEGGIFCLRLIHILKLLGVRNIYVNVIHERHKDRENYKEIYRALKSLTVIYKEYITTYKDIELDFIGDYKHRIEPTNRYRIDIRKEFDILKNLSKNSDAKINVYFMINYSTRWLANEGWKLFANLPEANVIVRHCKGYVNGDMWLYGKLDNNSFVYVQNGSVSKNWTDEQLIYLVGIALKSMIVNRGTHYLKSYDDIELNEIRRLREVKLSIVHEKLSSTPTKRAVMFSPVGPEIYEF